MFRSCFHCNSDLGENESIASFPVGRRLAFDSERGRLWVVCPHCRRWNLSPLDERYDAMDDAERKFERATLRVASDNVGMAQLRDGLQLVRIGRARRNELAWWRYGRFARMLPWRGGVATKLRGAAAIGGRVMDTVVRGVPRLRAALRYDATAWLRIKARADEVITPVHVRAVGDPENDYAIALLRYRHLDSTELVRPASGEPWTVRVQHEAGVVELTGDAGVRTAGKLLAAMNGMSGTPEDVEYAIRKLEDAGDPEGYFARVATLALRTAWGKHEPAGTVRPAAELVRGRMSETETLAFYVTARSFWGRGGLGSEPMTALPRLPLVDRLALEMAAAEDVERRAMQGELAELEAAWREAEEIARIADGLFDRALPSARIRWATPGTLLRGAPVLSPSA